MLPRCLRFAHIRWHPRSVERYVNPFCKQPFQPCTHTLFGVQGSQKPLYGPWSGCFLLPTGQKFPRFSLLFPPVSNPDQQGYFSYTVSISVNRSPGDSSRRCRVSRNGHHNTVWIISRGKIFRTVVFLCSCFKKAYRKKCRCN